MFKQYRAHDGTTVPEMTYVENVWTDTWKKERFELDVSYLQDSDYYKVLKTYLQPGSRILEGGCGMGQWVRFLTDRGYQATGVDISRETVQAFKGHFPGYDVRAGDVFKLDFANGTFDAYLSYGVIEHFEDGPAEIIAEAKRVLKPGGLFCVSVPWLNEQREKNFTARRVSDNRAEFGADDSVHFYQYLMSKQELQDVLTPHGFEVLKIYPVGADHTLKSRSPLVKGFAEKSKSSGGLVRILRPYLRKAWRFYVDRMPKEQHAHMIFAIARVNS